jgi:hypothetical protein
MKASRFSDAQKAFILKQGADDLPARREADAGPLTDLLGGEEGLKNLLAERLRHAAAGIPDHDGDSVVLWSTGKLICFKTVTPWGKRSYMVLSRCRSLTGSFITPWLIPD